MKTIRNRLKTEDSVYIQNMEVVKTKGRKHLLNVEKFTARILGEAPQIVDAIEVHREVSKVVFKHKSLKIV